MEHEFKIILGATIMDTKVLIDNEPVGWIQEIKIHASVDQVSPEIEVVFPDVSQWPEGHSKQQKSLEVFKDFPNVKISYRPLKSD